MVSACKPKDKNISSGNDSATSTTTSNDLVSSGEEELTGDSNESTVSGTGETTSNKTTSRGIASNAGSKPVAIHKVEVVSLNWTRRGYKLDRCCGLTKRWQRNTISEISMIWY